MKWQIKQFNQLVSTNDTAKTSPVGTVIIAKAQTGGKGRYGRSWESPLGNLYLSAVVPDFGKASSLLAFVAGLAVATALSDFHVRLKWPNDILLNGGKVAGILLERRDDGCVIIGIGVNVISCPTSPMLYKTACLNGVLSVSTVQEKVLTALSHYLSVFETQGFEPVRRDWLSLAVGLNQSIKVDLPRKTLIGTFKELSPQGELILETPDKIVHKITAGDVFLMQEK